MIKIYLKYRKELQKCQTAYFKCTQQAELQANALTLKQDCYHNVRCYAKSGSIDNRFPESVSEQMKQKQREQFAKAVNKRDAVQVLEDKLIRQHFLKASYEAPYKTFKTWERLSRYFANQLQKKAIDQHDVFATFNHLAKLKAPDVNPNFLEDISIQCIKFSKYMSNFQLIGVIQSCSRISYRNDKLLDNLVETLSIQLDERQVPIKLIYNLIFSLGRLEYPLNREVLERLTEWTSDLASLSKIQPSQVVGFLYACKKFGYSETRFEQVLKDYLGNDHNLQLISSIDLAMNLRIFQDIDYNDEWLIQRIADHMITNKRVDQLNLDQLANSFYSLVCLKCKNELVLNMIAWQYIQKYKLLPQNQDYLTNDQYKVSSSYFEIERKLQDHIFLFLRAGKMLSYKLKSLETVILMYLKNPRNLNGFDTKHVTELFVLCDKMDFRDTVLWDLMKDMAKEKNLIKELQPQNLVDVGLILAQRADKSDHDFFQKLQEEIIKLHKLFLKKSSYDARLIAVA